MRQFSALFKKEIVEHVRNFKLVATFIVFMIIGILSPLTALVTPQILEIALGYDFGEIKIPEPTAYDAFIQFFSNMNQMGLIIFVIVFGGILTNELTQGTLINLLTKGLSRKIVIVSKFMFVSIVWTVLYFLSGLVTYLYTIYYWDEKLHHLIMALTLTFVFGLFIIGLTMLFSVMTKSFIGVLMCIVITIAGVFLISIYKGSAPYLPITLIRQNIELLTGVLEIKETVKPLTMTSVFTILSLIGSILIFDKREMF